MRCKTYLQVAIGCVRFGPVSPSGFSSLNLGRACRGPFLFLPQAARASDALDLRCAAVAESRRCKSSRRVLWHDPADDKNPRRVTPDAARFGATRLIPTEPTSSPVLDRAVG